MLSLFTKVTCEPRATVSVFGLTPADVIVIVNPAGAGVGVGVGVPDPEGDVLLPPPHATITAASAMADRNPKVLVIFFLFSLGPHPQRLPSLTLRLLASPAIRSVKVLDRGGGG